MGKQTLVTISREYGSGGHEIAEILSKRLGISFYDRNILDLIAESKNVDGERLKRFGEKPRNVFLSRTVGGHSNSPEEIVAQMQFDYIKEKAESGESFVIVGRCAGQVLMDFKGVSRFFVRGDMETRIKRISEIRNVDAEEAKSIINRHDRNRKSYNNCYCDYKWGDSRGYDMTINSSDLGIIKTVDVLEYYIKQKM